jgi:AraC family transcriptional activator of pobA
MNAIQHIRSITEFHRSRNLPRPEHPLISVVKFEDMVTWEGDTSVSFIYDFYSIALKRNFSGRVKYGQQEYDFDEGLVTFVSPTQVLKIEIDPEAMAKHTGWLLLVHPDFLWKSPLAQKIRKYGYFDYAVNEALYLSEKEENIIIGILQIIRQEYQNNIDRFSQDLIISQIDSLLIYADRFYQRQFITRKVSSHNIIDRFDALLDAWFRNKEMATRGLPSVQNLAEELNVSPGYLSELLKVLTGLSAQQQIHAKLIDLAKERLTSSALSVAEIAYELGFEHPQSFTKLFKMKTSLSPLQFRQSFN